MSVKHSNISASMFDDYVCPVCLSRLQVYISFTDSLKDPVLKERINAMVLKTVKYTDLFTFQYLNLLTLKDRYYSAEHLTCLCFS